MSSTLDRIVQKTLAKDKNLRYSSAADLQKDLNLFLNRNDPNFSKQDFTQFIKELYADEILRNQKETQYQYQQDLIQKKERTEVATEFKKRMEKLPKRKTQLKKLDPNSSLDVTNPQGSAVESPSYLNKDVSQSISYYHTTQRKETQKWFSIFFILLLAGAISYYLTQERDTLNDLKKMVHLKLNKKAKSKIPSERKYSSTPIPPTPKHIVYIQSQPQGAEIFINNRTTGLFTPSRISVKGKTRVHLLLQKELYLPYSQILYITKGQNFKASLAKAEIGYVDISVTNGGKNPTVFINGQRVHGGVPISRYAIPARKKVLIRAVNFITNVKASKRVRVKENERKSIHLVLK